MRLFSYARLANIRKLAEHTSTCVRLEIDESDEKDIADEIEMDISTISRVANSKYVDTPYGTKLLKEFFSESMKTTSGEEISTIEIKKILEKIISDENKRKL